MIRWSVPITVSWLAPVAPIARYFIRMFLGQDRLYVDRQREGLLSKPKLMLIDDADTQVRWWMRLKGEWMNAQAESRPFCNPIKKQTLRWRG